MDITTIIGLVAGAFFMAFPIIMQGGNFIDPGSMMLTIGGGIASTLISYRMSEITKITKVVKNAFFGKEGSPTETIRLLVDLSQKARREGLLALESEQERIEDEYIRQSLQLIVDGVEPETIRESMSLELENLEARHAKGQGLFKTMGAMFPAWGMIGTLIGLVQLLGQLEDPNAIGPAMAIALITTFYGSVLANFVCIPIANKLGLKSKEEIQVKEMIIEGILSIQAGENPRIMEHKLKTFLSPEQKRIYNDEFGDGAKGKQGGKDADSVA